MSRVDKQALVSELRKFAHRNLCNGELVLLSYAIANHLPLIEDQTTSINVTMVTHSRLIERIVYTLQEHAGLNNDSITTIKNQVGRFLLWRTEVAKGGMPILFSGEHDTVIDDLSGLLRFIDNSVLCSVGDVAIKANWTLRTFTDLVLMEKETLANQGA